MGEKPKPRTSWGALIFLAVILFALLGSIWPSLKKAKAAGERTSALSNCKALAGGLVAFKTEYGSYPCDSTRELLHKKGIRNLPNRTDANAYLAQLIATEAIYSETDFHCKAGNGYHKGDDDISSPTSLLAPGENSYAYVMAPAGKPLSRPASITPICHRSRHFRRLPPTFDPSLFGSYYVYGAADGSGKQGKTSPDGLARSKGRDHLFQTGEDSLFGDQIPDVKIPTRKY